MSTPVLRALVEETRAKLTMPSAHLLCGAPYTPSWAREVRTATVPYLAGHSGLVQSINTAHSSARR